MVKPDLRRQFIDAVKLNHLDIAASVVSGDSARKAKRKRERMRRERRDRGGGTGKRRLRDRIENQV